MSEKREVESERWYLAVKQRSQRFIEIGAAVQTLLMTWYARHIWWQLLFAIGFATAIFGLNIGYDRFAAKRWGVRGELYRSIINNVVAIPMYVLIEFELPVWFWLLFYAVTLDATTFRGGLATILAICGIHTVSAVLYGVPVHVPVLFSLITLVVFGISFARSQFIHEMLIAAQTKREELARAHDDLKAEIAARERAETELRQAQKLEAIGRLAAGVAHEINTPMQFVSDSLAFVADGTSDLIALAQKAATPEDAADADLAYLSDEMPTSLAQAQAGVRRVAEIIRSMKELAHPGSDDRSPVDLNHAIANTLVMTRYEYKLVAEVETDLGEVPVVLGNAGELNQVLLNLVVNAAHAVEDVMKRTGKRGKIKISSRQDDDCVELRISDTGDGIPSPIRSQIFEPFFTTKAVGRGTGQGLPLARAVIERHHGSLTYETAQGAGTTFIIRIPTSQPSVTSDATRMRAA